MDHFVKLNFFPSEKKIKNHACDICLLLLKIIPVSCLHLPISYLCEHFHIYVYCLCVFWMQPPSSPLWFTRSHSPPTNPTISAAAAASLIMSALTSWRYQQQQQQFLFQSLRYMRTYGNSSPAPHEVAPRKIGTICTTTILCMMHLFQAHCLKLYIKKLGNKSVLHIIWKLLNFFSTLTIYKRLVW